MKRTLVWYAVLIVTLCGSLAMRPVHADAPLPFALVTDINTAANSISGMSGNTLFAVLGNTVVFSGYAPQTGRELWRTDGTDAGTQLVTDINIGQGTGLSYDSTGWLVLDNALLFQGNNGALGTELWRSDGTAAGTTMLQDLWSGADSGTPKNFVAVGGRAFFTAQISETQQTLWITDGTTGGTMLLHAFSAITTPFVVMGNVLLFSAAENGGDDELWKSDGTPGGTVLVKDINPGSAGSYPQRMFARSTSQVLFNADDGTHGSELWRSDGTDAGTVLVKDINPGAAVSNPADITRLPGGITIFDPERIVFSAYANAYGRELWITDGTEAGTQLIKDVYPNAPSAAPSPLGIASSRGKGRSRAFFAMTDNTSGKELWITDGTFTNTLMLADINPGTGSSDPSTFVFAGSSFFFTAANVATGRELWKTDGTAAGTAQVADINPGTTGSTPQDLTMFNNTLYFRADDGVHGSELWSSDGGSATLLKDVWVGPDNGVQEVLGVALGALYFVADDGTTGREMWKTDGTPQGTVQVKNVAPDVGGIYLYTDGGNATALGDTLIFAPDNVLWQSDGTGSGTSAIKSFPAANGIPWPYDLTTLGDSVLFGGSDSIGVTELWSSDGSAAGTGILTNTVKPYFGYVHSPARLNDLVVFGVYTGTLPTQNADFASLWKTDGTPQGTQLVKANIESYGYTASGSTLFFAGRAANSNNTELWKTNGTPGGTALVRDIVPGDTGSNPQHITPGAPGEVFFIARAGSDGYQLWRSDGTEAGTLLVHDVLSSDNTYEYGEFAYVNGTLFFTADDGIHGSELWKSDGTTGGTSMVADLYPGSGASNPQELIGLNGAVYFSATRPEGRRTLWRSDGSAAGAQPVRTGTGSPLNPFDLTVVQGQLLFSAADDAHGRELWRSDGTATGTVLLQDIVPGADSSNPQAPIMAGQRVYLTADTPGVGRELWALVPGGMLTPTPTPPTGTPQPGEQRVYLPLTQR